MSRACEAICACSRCGATGAVEETCAEEATDAEEADGVPSVSLRGVSAGAASRSTRAISSTSDTPRCCDVKTTSREGGSTRRAERRRAPRKRTQSDPTPGRYSSPPAASRLPARRFT